MTPAQEDRFRHLVAEYLGVDLKKVTDDAGFIDDLGADSLDVVEIAMTIEEEFNIDLGERDFDSAVTVGGALTYLRGELP